MPLDTPFRQPAPARGSLRRVVTLTARAWRARVCARARDASGLEPEGLAAVEPAFRASIAGLAAASMAGFGLLRPGCEAGGLAFSACWWEAPILRRTALLLLGCGGAPSRDGTVTGRVGDVCEIPLTGRGAASWSGRVLETEAPSLDAYFAEFRA